MSTFHPFDTPTVPVPPVNPFNPVDQQTMPMPVPPAAPAAPATEPAPSGGRGPMALLKGWRSPQHRDGMALVLSSGLTSAIGLLYWVVAARMFDHATVGLNSAVISTMMLLGTASHLNLGNAMLRFVPVAGSWARPLIRRCNAAAITAGVVFGLVFAVGAPRWAPDLVAAVGHPALFLFFVISTPVWTLFVVQDSTLAAIKRATAVPVKNLVFSVLKIVLLGVAALMATQSGIAISWVVGTIVCVVGVSLWLHRVTPPGPERGTQVEPPVTMRDVAGFIRYDYAGNVCWQFATFGLPLVVLAVAGPEANATYNMAWQIALALYLIINGMGQSLVAHLSADPSKLDSAVRSMVVKAMTLLLPAVIVIAPGAYLILWLFGQEYADTGALLLALLALSAIPNVVTQTTVWVARVQRRGAVQVALPAVLAALVVLGTVVLLPVMGVTGVGVAWLGAQTLVAGFVLVNRAVLRRRR